MAESDSFAALARDAILLAYSIDKSWYEETTPYEYEPGDDVAMLVSRARALGMKLPELVTAD